MSFSFSENNVPFLWEVVSDNTMVLSQEIKSSFGSGYNYDFTDTTLSESILPNRIITMKY